VAEYCCGPGGGEPCVKYEYWFEEEVVMDSISYYRPASDSVGIGNSFFGEYYREENGKVYMILNSANEEKLIYDFNLEIGEQISYQNDQIIFETIAIDSVTLLSGERRKRLEMQLTVAPYQTTFWIEGIGGIVSPMEPSWTFAQDCNRYLRCYYKGSNLEYSLDDNCELTDVVDIIQVKRSISYYPNPTKENLTIKYDTDQKLKSIEIVAINGSTLMRLDSPTSESIDLNDLQSGLYLIKAVFVDGSIGVIRFIKN